MLRIETSFTILMQLARNLAKAEQTGDCEKIREAKIKYDNYAKLCTDPEVTMSLNTNTFNIIT